MTKDKKQSASEKYLKAVKKVDREREIAAHGKLISTRPTRIVKSKKIYSRKGNKKNPDFFSSDFFVLIVFTNYVELQECSNNIYKWSYYYTLRQYLCQRCQNKNHQFPKASCDVQVDWFPRQQQAV